MIVEKDKDYPYTDDQLVQILCHQGIDVNRRTVAKYRADMKIPSTHQRRNKNWGSLSPILAFPHGTTVIR